MTMTVLTGWVVETVPVGVVWVVVTVVAAGTAATTAMGAAGGGADTTCDSGSEEHPARKATAPKQIKAGVRDANATPFFWGAEEVIKIVFIFKNMDP